MIILDISQRIFFDILCAFVVTGVTTTKSTAVPKLESGFTWKLLGFVWSE